MHAGRAVARHRAAAGAALRDRTLPMDGRAPCRVAARSRPAAVLTRPGCLPHSTITVSARSDAVARHAARARARGTDRPMWSRPRSSAGPLAAQALRGVRGRCFSTKGAVTWSRARAELRVIVLPRRCATARQYVFGFENLRDVGEPPSWPGATSARARTSLFLAISASREGPRHFLGGAPHAGQLFVPLSPSVGGIRTADDGARVRLGRGHR